MAAAAVAFLGDKAEDSENATDFANYAGADNTDVFVEGTQSVGLKTSSTTNVFVSESLAGGASGVYDFSSGGADEGEHIWVMFNGLTPVNATSGFQISIIEQNATTNAQGDWYTPPATGYTGGFVTQVIDPARDFDNTIAGTPGWTGTGNPAQLTNVDGLGGTITTITMISGNFQNVMVDAMSIGFGYEITDGTGGNDGTFADFVTYENTNNFGPVAGLAGLVLATCQLIIGDGSTTTDFDDTGFTVLWEDRLVAADFYKLEVTASATAVFTNGTFKAEDPLSTLGRFSIDVSGATAATFTNCIVDGATIISLDGNTTVTDGTWSNIDYIDLGGQPTISGLTILDPQGVSPVSSDGAALIINAANEMANVDGVSFDGAGVGGTAQDAAIEVDISGAGPFTIDLDNISFSNRVGSSVDLHILQNSDADYTFNLLNGTPTPTYTNDGTGTVTAEATVSVTVTARDAADQSAISGARVLVEADTGGDLPAGETVTITASGTLATVTHTAHGAPDGSNVIIRNVDQDAYNGSHTITVNSANEYEYTMGSSPSSPATIRSGESAITATSEILSSTTNGSGVATNSSFVYTSDQPVTGRVRQGTSSPYYKTSPLSGTITSNGVDVTTFLVGDD